jgi:hypothetical protein
MLDAVLRAPPELFLGAGLLLGIAAWLISRGIRPARIAGRIARWPLRLPLMLLAALGGLGVGGALWLVAPYLGPWLVTDAHRTPATCAEARAMGYGSARVGERGYFAHLDADRDGVSCEPVPWWRR